MYVNTLSKVNEADLSTWLVITNIETSKVNYRLMPSSSSNFVGRADDLAKLEAVFVEGRAKTGSRPVSVLAGLGGMGKTQMSVRFAETRSHL
jgi:Holliday junction resolvasome RuvABC ATP-dependent DNA helicase subunit